MMMGKERTKGFVRSKFVRSFVRSWRTFCRRLFRDLPFLHYFACFFLEQQQEVVEQKKKKKKKEKGRMMFFVIQKTKVLSKSGIISVLF